ncbi:MAG: ABC transporter ATP-binding protein [Deltaproteobacteria bacterium]
MLKINNLMAGYGNATVLKGINIEIKSGEFVSIIGPNGAGKSTLLKCIFGIIKPSSGSIQFEDQNLRKMDSSEIIKKGLMLCPEGRQLVGTLTVQENIQLGAYLRNDDIKEDFHLIYQLFPRLQERKAQQARTLSGGEQQMTAIARALMGKPKLLILDEVTLGLAPIIIKEIGRKLLDLNKMKITMLLVEQNAQLALNLSDRSYVMEYGRIVKEGLSKDLKNDRDVQAAYLGV